MREIGFDGYAIDFVECPPPMRTYLMQDCQFHRTVSLSSHPTESVLTMRAADRTPTEPRRSCTRDGGCFPHRWRELRTWQYTEHGHALAIWATSSAEPHTRHPTCAHPRRTRRFVRFAPPQYSFQMTNVDSLLPVCTVDPTARQNIERRIAQGRDQLALCAEEGRRLGDLDREIKREQNAHKEAVVSPSRLP